ncbi:hypothetical protein BG46_07080 [Brucella anthropi]|uniref:carbohydrate kinase family protein n=1 Tax=Brucella anthropi TaxID=529 RepID=UPI00045208EA|nr:carbohydrate kinase family protein [Brucella anthropi]EXL02517.1 hypothetical protein BG46_07080 [Brucella anthropi]
MSPVVLAIGDLTVDQIFATLRDLPAWGQETEVDRMEVRLGGNTGNFALAGKRLGLDVRCAGPIGNDDNGIWIRKELERKGLNTDLLDIRDGSATSVTTALVREDGERLFITLPGALTKLGKMLQRSFPAAELALFSGWCQPPRVRKEILHDVFARLKAAGTKIAVDLAWSEASWSARGDVLEVLSKVDFALMNSDEATALTGEADLIVAAEKLYAQLGEGAVLVVKNGERGALLRQSGKPSVTIPAIKITGQVQAVGAGDSFNAGFIHALAAQQLDAEAATAFGCDFATWMLTHGRDEAVDPTVIASLRRHDRWDKSGEPA